MVLRRPDGNLVTRTYPAQEATGAAQRALAQGLQIVSQQEIAPKSADVGRFVSRFPTLLFSQQLLALLESGLTLTEVIHTLLAKESSPAHRQVVLQLDEALAQGFSFSTALAQLPAAFPEIYVATVRAAERTGDLAQALTRYIAYQQQFDDIRKKLVSAAIYPAMLLLVGGFVSLFLLGYVVPKFSTVYESAGRELPWTSSALLAFGQFIHRYSLEIITGATAGALSAYAYLRRPTARASMARGFMRLPWLARQIHVFQLARFYRGLSLLLTSGIALPQAMVMVSGLLGNGARERLQSAREAVESGQSLSAALIQHQLSTPVADSLIKVGERSGQMARMLERTAKFHDEEFSRWVDWASRLLEPLLMVAIGLVIGTVVVLLYVPIFELAGSLQ
ncbi:MAG: type II secretion system F family protein [Azonexus sp.]